MVKFVREVVWYRGLQPLWRRLRIPRRSQSHGMSRAEADKLWPPPERCVHCGGWHPHSCPRVRELVFRGEGPPARVTFWAWGEWPADQVVFPWQKAEMITQGDESSD